MSPDSAHADDPPVVVIVGETGSGKSALAVELAKRYDGEIIAADSRTVYKGMDIGTAKPPVAERQGIVHHGFDVVPPDGQFTAYDFRQLANKEIVDITGRGKLPIIVGGTGLYIDAFLYNFAFRPPLENRLRDDLRSMTVPELQARIRAVGLPLPVNATNPRHLARLLESGQPPRQDRVLRSRTLVLGLRLERPELEQRIVQRVEDMFAAGLIEETARLHAQYGGIEALRTPGYRAVVAYLSGALSVDEAKQQFVRADLHLAKRQRTWFKRNNDIHWLGRPEMLQEAVDLVTTRLLG